MLFRDLAHAWDASRLEDKGFRRIPMTESEALQAYALLFPKKTLTVRKALSKIADDVATSYEVLLDMAGERPALLLASESSASNASNWSLSDALDIRESIMEGEYPFLPLSIQMSEIEARLLWASVLGERTPFTKLQYMRTLNGQMEPKTILGSKSFLTDEEIISALHRDTDLLFNPKHWYEKPTAALRKRIYTSWSKHKSVGLEDFNGALYQEIPTGAITLEYDEEENVIIERSGSVITDVAYPEHPQLILKDRLSAYAETHEDEIAWPKMIPSWESLVKNEKTIRFPAVGPFSPMENGGFVLVKTSCQFAFRISAYQNTGTLRLKLQALDGIEDFIDIGVCEVSDPSERSSIMFDIERRTDAHTDVTEWCDISEDVCIIVTVSSPFLDRHTDTMSEPIFIKMENEMGISDVTQYVDLVGVEHV